LLAAGNNSCARRPFLYLVGRSIPPKLRRWLLHPPDGAGALGRGAHDALHQPRHEHVRGAAAPGAHAQARHVPLHLGADQVLHRGHELGVERVRCRGGSGGGCRRGRGRRRREFLELAVRAVVVEPAVRAGEREGQRRERVLLVPPAHGAVRRLEPAGARHGAVNLHGARTGAVAEVAAVGPRSRRAVRRQARPLAGPLELRGVLDRGAGGGELALERAVPVVLDGVVGAPGEEARDGGPAVAEPGVRVDDGGVLLRRERAALHLRRQLVAPPQPARLARPAGDLAPDGRPVARALVIHQAPQHVVLLGAPRAPDPVALRLNAHIE
jgi:hypothetical protein